MQDALTNYYRALWLEVIARALHDVKEAKPRYRDAALEWVNSGDFPEVCILAGLDAERLQAGLASRHRGRPKPSPQT